MCAQSHRHVQLFAMSWTMAYQAPLSVSFFQQKCWSGLPFSSSKGSSQSRDQTHISCIDCIQSLPLRHLGGPCFIIVIAFLSCPLLRCFVCFHLCILLWLHVQYTSGMGMLTKSLSGESKEYLVSYYFKHKLSLNLLSLKVKIFSLEMNI